MENRLLVSLYIYPLRSPPFLTHILHHSSFSRLCSSPMPMTAASSSFLPSLSLDDGSRLGRRRLESSRALASCAAAPAGARQVRVAIAQVWAAASFKEARVSDGDKKNERPIVVIDNYDSFTYNLCQYIGELGVDYEVYRNDELTVEDIRRKNPKGILISPGPGAPQESGISLQTVLELGPSIPLFGVCMGLQCIGEAFGGNIVRAPSGVRHGKSSLVYYDEKLGENLFDGLPNPFSACRYHSLVIEKETFPADKLEITAWTEDGLIMAARHKKYKHIKGVQFHPESIITTDGKTIILNFIKLLDKFQEFCKNEDKSVA